MSLDCEILQNPRNMRRHKTILGIRRFFFSAGDKNKHTARVHVDMAWISSHVHWLDLSYVDTQQPELDVMLAPPAFMVCPHLNEGRTALIA